MKRNQNKLSLKSILENVVKYLRIRNNIDIIGIGEATHGQKKINILRTELFKILANNDGFTTFVLEDQYSTCELVNNYIHGDKTFKLDHIIKSLFVPWQSIEIYNLIIWMRKYNKKNNNILDFKGIDVQFYNSDYKNDDDEILKYTKIINRKLDEMYEQNTQLHESDKGSMKLRDKSMYEVFLKMYLPTKKYFIYAHNGHISNGGNHIRKNLGYWLTKHFNNKYLSIGNSFNGRSYRGYNFIIKKQEIADFNGPIDLSKVRAFNIDNDDYEFIKISRDMKLSDGLTTSDDLNFKNKYVVGTGTIANAAEPYNGIYMYQINDFHDAIIQIPNETEIEYYWMTLDKYNTLHTKK